MTASLPDFFARYRDSRRATDGESHTRFFPSAGLAQSQDNFGILHAKYLAARPSRSVAAEVERLCVPAYFIASGQLLAELFDRCPRPVFSTLVGNEYVRLLGLVTLEDGSRSVRRVPPSFDRRSLVHANFRS